MSFEVFKSRRSTDFWREPVSGNKVGPGSYNINKVPFQNRKINGIAPFSSMIERFKNDSAPNTARLSQKPDQIEVQNQLQGSFIQGKQLQNIPQPIENSMAQQSIFTNNAPGQTSTLNVHAALSKDLNIGESNLQQTSQGISAGVGPSKHQMVNSNQNNNNLNASRITAPNALLGTEVQSSIIENPGPGFYKGNETDWVKENKLDHIKEIFREQGLKQREKLQQAINEIEGDKKKKKIKPSIPSKKQSKNGYTGIQNDNPGPSGYNPKDEIVKSKSSAAIFSKSKVERELFHINSDIKGIQDYEIKNDATSKKDFSKAKSSAIFESKVPNCKDLKNEKADLPGPGTYELLLDKTSNFDRAGTQSEFSRIGGEFNNTKTTNYLRQAMNQPSLTRIMECPFVDIQQKEMVPGPGNYFYQDSKDKIMSRLKIQQYEAFVKPKPAFNTQTLRDCNKIPEKIDPMGPGAYININNPANSSFNKTLLKLQTDRLLKHAFGVENKPFGSSTQRFQTSQKLQQIDESKNFGLASSNTLEHIDQFIQVKKTLFNLTLMKSQSKKLQQIMKYGRIRESKSQGSFQFKSKARRIQFQDQFDPNVITINTDSGADMVSGSAMSNYLKIKDQLKHTINCQSQADCGEVNSIKPNQLTHRVSYKKPVYFDSSADRFEFSQIAKNTLDQTPGPGAYEINQLATLSSTRPHSKAKQNRSRSQLKAGFNSSEQKFNPKFSSYISKQSSEIIGPGQYHHIENATMIKKSYNMAIEGGANLF
eukprot:403333354